MIRCKIKMKSLFRSYQNLLMKYPLGSQAVQTGFLMGSGDLIAQTLVEKRSLKQIDFVRAGNFTLLGVFLVGPSLHKWYGALDKYFKGEGKLVVLKKVAADQLLFAPVFLALIMSVVDLTQGKTMKDIKRQLKRDYLDVLLNGYKLWPAVQLVNFYLVPLQYRVLTIQVVAIFWNTYFSWKINESNWLPANQTRSEISKMLTPNMENHKSI